MREKKIIVLDADLMSNDRKISFPYPIKEVREIDDKFFVILKIPYKTVFNRNIYCLNKNLEILWQIEECKTGGGSDKPYIEIYFNKNNDLVASCWNGCDCVIDKETGKIKNIELVK